MMVEHGGEPHPSLRMVPYNIWNTTELLLIANRSMGEVGKFVMMGLVELFKMKEMKINSLSGPGQAPVSKRCRDQCSEEDAVRRLSNPSRSNGTNTPGTTVGWMLGSYGNNC